MSKLGFSSPYCVITVINIFKQTKQLYQQRKQIGIKTLYEQVHKQKKLPKITIAQ